MDGEKDLPSETLNEPRLGGNPTQTATRRDSLGEGVKANDTTVNVHAEVRGDQRIDEVIARGLALADKLMTRKFLGVVGLGKAARLGLRNGSRRELEVPVRVILDDDDVKLAAESVKLLATLGGEDTTGGIVAHANLVVST